MAAPQGKLGLPRKPFLRPQGSPEFSAMASSKTLAFFSFLAIVQVCRWFLSETFVSGPAVSGRDESSVAMGSRKFRKREIEMWMNTKMQKASEAERDNEDFVAEAIDGDPRAFAHASVRLRKDVDFIMKMLKVSPRVVDFMHEDVYADKDLIEDNEPRVKARIITVGLPALWHDRHPSGLTTSGWQLQEIKQEYKLLGYGGWSLVPAGFGVAKHPFCGVKTTTQTTNWTWIPAKQKWRKMCPCCHFHGPDFVFDSFHPRPFDIRVHNDRIDKRLISMGTSKPPTRVLPILCAAAPPL
eukprot:Skav223385  [mRNA]  locus=scaffold2634:315074:323215:+ [translate_table: standard]